MTGDPVLLPDRLPVDEDHPLRPREAYALSKVLGEQMLDALVRRRDNAMPQPDNIRGEPLADMVAAAYGDDAPPIGELARPDVAGALGIAKARRLFGWEPRVGLAAR